MAASVDVVFIQHITAAFQQVGGANALQDAKMNREEVTLVLTRMFNGVSQELPGHVTAAGSEETGSLMFRLFERSDPSPGLDSDRCCRTSVPAAVQEEDVFGSVEAAVSSCFTEVSVQKVCERSRVSELFPERPTDQEAQNPPSSGISSSFFIKVSADRGGAVQSAGLLSQALRKMEAKHANNTPQSFITQHTDRGNVTPTSDSLTDAEEAELLKEEDDWSQNEPQTPSPTIPHQSTVSQDELFHEEELNEKFNHQPIGQQGEPQGVGLQTNVPFLSDREDLGMCSPEDLLQKTVDRLKMEMEDKWTERNTGETQRDR
ncbi:hypothetical protein XENOCAPTIV_030141 [Xenoophorus captivus]|uniref:EF-hand domain-containing protein n=1 Tax=Xenoophorus captivus TaxID=1517983 RepID=A0ABV0RNE0_9TELE